MKLALCSIFICLIINFTFAAVANIGPNPNRQEGHCVGDNDVGSLKYGEKKSLKGCVEARCNNDGSIELLSCGVVDVQDPCELFQDDSKPYPDCCPKPVCPILS